MHSPLQNGGENFPVTYLDVASFFMAVANESGEVLTNLKLQKLVYYAQAWYLANNKKPLFEANFEAWVHGPVIPELYKLYKESGADSMIPVKKVSEIKEILGEEVSNFLDEIVKTYMPYGGYHLELMTHAEAPWINARANYEPDQICTEIIPQDSMLEYYGKRIED
jgi:uncharacterized phage-associated protein